MISDLLNWELIRSIRIIRSIRYLHWDFVGKDLVAKVLEAHHFLGSHTFKVAANGADRVAVADN